MADGKVIESWHNVDDLGLLQQIGSSRLPDSSARFR
jgi:hypothetical protein